jgi:hypothetical protein
MNEEHQIHIYEEETETEEEKEKKQRLKDIFSDLEKKQPDFLDEAAKSIIERIATFLAILFAVIALGGTFPPKFLVHNTQNTVLVIAILLCYLVAMGMGMWAIQPRNYDLYQYNMTRLEQEWKRLIGRKKFWVRFSGLLFGLGTVVLAVLIVFIIWPT